MHPTIISCYTNDTLYEEEIKDLILSCENLNLEYSIDGYDSLESWEKNCCYKPKYILKKPLGLKKPLLWIDADGIVVKRLIFDAEIKNLDIAFVRNMNKKNN
ncbi:MAG: hypothetical protein WCT85_06425 [Parachlamydiales bacterium]|jgi:hypothetical protein